MTYCIKCNKTDHITRNCGKKCRVIGCTMCKIGNKHYCKMCLNTDSMHYSSECPYNNEEPTIIKRVGVYTVYKHDDKWYLLACINKSTGKLDTSGGKIEGIDKDSKTAACRETKEEFDIEIYTTDLQFLNYNTQYKTICFMNILNKIIFTNNPGSHYYEILQNDELYNKMNGRVIEGNNKKLGIVWCELEHFISLVRKQIARGEGGSFLLVNLLILIKRLDYY